METVEEQIHQEDALRKQYIQRAEEILDTITKSELEEFNNCSIYDSQVLLVLQLQLFLFCNYQFDQFNQQRRELPKRPKQAWEQIVDKLALSTDKTNIQFNMQ